MFDSILKPLMYGCLGIGMMLMLAGIGIVAIVFCIAEDPEPTKNEIRIETTTKPQGEIEIDTVYTFQNFKRL